MGLQQQGGDWALSPQKGPRQKKCFLRQNSPSNESPTRRSAATSFPGAAGGPEAGQRRARPQGDTVHCGALPPGHSPCTVSPLCSYTTHLEVAVPSVPTPGRSTGA